jgi:hypothetical protein
MWNLDLPELGGLTPAEQLWVLAQAVEENGGPPDYVLALRRLAERFEDLGWWLAEPLYDPEGRTTPTGGPVSNLR